MTKFLKRIRGNMLAIVVLLGLLMSVMPAHADIVKTITLTATLEQFSEGRFGLTGLTADGGVQLVPLGVLKDWTSAPNPMCYQVGDMGTASFGPYLYAVGGSVRNGTDTVHIPSVCRTRVIDAEGATEPWQTLPAENLPQARTTLGLVAVKHPDNSGRGILYAFGGKDADSFSTNTIFSAIINTNGSLQPWVTEERIIPFGRDRMAVTAYQKINDVTGAVESTHIYFIGGYMTDINPLSFREVRRLTVDSNGVLSDWVMDDPVPLNVSNPDCLTQERYGIYNSEAINFEVMTETTAGISQALLLIGGIVEIAPGDSTAQCQAGFNVVSDVYMAEIMSNGDLRWTSNDITRYTLPQGAHQLRAVGVNQKIYAMGGAILDNGIQRLTNRVFSSYSTTEFELASFSIGVTQTSNFIANETALSDSQARAAHGLEYVEIDGTSIAYLFGGTNINNQFRDDVLFGLIGTADDSEGTVGYASPGLYISRAYDLRAAGDITSFKWNATVDEANDITDIRMEYRTSNSVGGLSSAQWIAADGDVADPGRDSSLGENIYTDTLELLGRYVQYKATLTTQDPGEPTATPILRNVRIGVTIEGFPSLVIPSASLGPVIQGGFATVNIQVANQAPPPPNNGTAIDADIEATGTLYVDMYVFPPGAQVITPTQFLDGSYDQSNSVAFATVNRSILRANDPPLVLDSDAWSYSCYPFPCTPRPGPINWGLIFNEPGLWTVMVIVDSNDDVTEADAITDPWEQDNITTFIVDSSVSGGGSYLPIIHRP